MKPKPLVVLKNFTVPVFTTIPFDRRSLTRGHMPIAQFIEFERENRRGATAPEQSSSASSMRYT
jgi:hypothetical protein